MHVCHCHCLFYFYPFAYAIIAKWKMTSSVSLYLGYGECVSWLQGFVSYMSDVFFSSGENGDVEYYEEFPIRLVHQFEGI